MNAKFICFEGIDGVGKTTQAALLAVFLRSMGIPCWQTREPSGSLEIHPHLNKLNLEQQALLFSADRMIHCLKIQEVLAQDVWVICDRFAPSTYAYQLSEKKLSQMLTMDAIARQGFGPNITFLLAAPIDVIAAREKLQTEDEQASNQWRDRMEFIQESYPMACAFSGYFLEIDANRQTQAIAADIQRIVTEEFGLNG